MTAFAALEAFGLTCRLCPSGRVRLTGDRPEDRTRVITVEISRPFGLATVPTTQGVWQRVMGSTPWIASETGKPRGEVVVGDDYPATWVSWHDAMAFCATLAERTGIPVTVPSEAHWEYAYRAGTDGDYYWGSDLQAAPQYAVGTFFDRAARATVRPGMQPVRSKPANPWGLFDMAGLVSEWVLDRYPGEEATPHIRAGTYPFGTTVRDWVGTTGDMRMLRKSGFGSPATTSTAWSKRLRQPSYAYEDVGFRIMVP